MEKFKKFKINNQQSIIGGKMADLEETTMRDGGADLWDSDNRRFIILK